MLNQVFPRTIDAGSLIYLVAQVSQDLGGLAFPDQNANPSKLPLGLYSC